MVHVRTSHCYFHAIIFLLIPSVALSHVTLKSSTVHRAATEQVASNSNKNVTNPTPCNFLNIYNKPMAKLELNTTLTIMSYCHNA